MLAKEIMTKPVIAVSPLTPVKSLAKILIKNNISGVPVLDNRKRLVGIVSERDIVAGLAKSGADAMISLNVRSARRSASGFQCDSW